MKRYIAGNEEKQNPTKIDWHSFHKFLDVIDEFMPDRGEGDTKASQIVTAVNKLVYKWFNDGDVYDNTNLIFEGFNDLSSYANWLYNNVRNTRDILDKIYRCKKEQDYTDLLYDLAEATLDDDFLAEYAEQPAQGSIYDEDGPFVIEEIFDEEDEYDEWEDADDYGDEEY